jgi:hypothetical protein
MERALSRAMPPTWKSDFDNERHECWVQMVPISNLLAIQPLMSITPIDWVSQSVSHLIVRQSVREALCILVKLTATVSSNYPSIHSFIRLAINLFIQFNPNYSDFIRFLIPRNKLFSYIWHGVTPFLFLPKQLLDGYLYYKWGSDCFVFNRDWTTIY